MAIKIKFKNENVAYNYLKLQLKELDYYIDNPIEINYGIQFFIEKNSRTI